MSSMFNKTKAVSCPRSWDEYLEAASKLCPQIDGKYNYICVPNQNKTELVQFCFRTGKFPAWQIAEHCPYLHGTGNMNSENCTSFSYGCPRKHYMTRDIYKYPACLEVNTERGCYIADSNCIFNDCETLTSAVTPATEYVVTLALSVVFGMAFCLLTSSLLVYFICIRRKRNNRKRTHKDIDTYPTKRCEITENEHINLLEKSQEKDIESTGEQDDEESSEPNVLLNKRNGISEQSTDIIHISKINALSAACMKGQIEMCQYLIDRYPYMLNQVNDEGRNTAYYAALGGNVKILELLKDKGVDLTHRSNTGSNILHAACKKSHLEMCQYIIQHYPDMLKQVNNDGNDAALYAAKGGNLEILKLLEKKGVVP